MVESTTTDGIDSGPSIWPALALAQVRDALRADTAPRIVIVGPAGSDKSPLARAISEHRAVPADRTRDGVADPTMLVDDGHLLSDADIEALHRHLDGEGAGLVLACRPWPRSAALTTLIRRIEQTGPAIALGQVDARDVERSLRRDGRMIAASCLQELVDLSGSVTWLVRQAVAAHGDDPCLDPAHDRVVRAVGESVALRLDTIDPAAADAVRRASLSGEGDLPAAIDAAAGDALAAGHAEGLLLRGGYAVPIVRSTVRRTTPVAHIIALLEQSPGTPFDATLMEGLGKLHDPRVARSLLLHADETAGVDSERALELYDAALAAGAAPVTVAIRKARIAWSRGDVDEVAALIDAVALDSHESERAEVIRLLGATWAARGFLRAAAATYRAQPLSDALIRAHGAVAAFGVGDAGPLRQEVREENETRNGFPTTIRVAHSILLRGLANSISTPPTGSLDDLLRASETYGESGEHGATPELPAVLAAIAAVNAGELDTAATVLSDALMAEHGGPWARARLLLWSAWVAVHRQHPEESAARLADVDSSVLPLSGREVLLRNAVMLAHVRRYGSPAELHSLWDRVRDDIRHIEIDLFAAHPVCEFVVTSALFDDGERTAAAFDGVVGILAELGDPPLWSAHVLWSAHQRAVIAGDANGQAQIAKALANAARHSRVAATMAAATAEWARSRVDDGDVDRIERAASRLAAAGLGWDGARLALTLSERTRDRRAASRLAAFARQLHASAGPTMGGSASSLADNGLLSAREREVATLVLSGMTYAEIGESIFISPRTAEHHMARIRRRLGATSRTDLIAKLQTIVGTDDGGSEEPGDR